MNTRARDLRSQNQDDKPEGWKQPHPDVNIDSQNSVTNRAELDGVNLYSSNWSSMAPGNRGHGRQDENPGMKAQMSGDEHTDIETKDDSTEPLPNEGRDDDSKIQEGWKQKREERRKKISA